MPAIEISIDEKTGEMSVDIHGVVGPACNDIENLIRKLAGSPESVELKSSYYQQPVQVRQQNRQGGGR